jgi:hypothetical protein
VDPVPVLVEPVPVLPLVLVDPVPVLVEPVPVLVEPVPVLVLVDPERKMRYELCDLCQKPQLLHAHACVAY